MDFEDSNQLFAAIQKLRANYLKSVRISTISQAQKATLRGDPVKGPIWVSKFTISPSTQDTSRELLLALIDKLNHRNVHFDRPDSQPLKFEWLGCRHGVEKGTQNL
ncbi:hypothetical protein BDV06DRAFT_45830 [Aspergillus oleicola]